SERQHGIYDCLEMTSLQQLSNPGQLFMIRFNDKKCLFHAGISRCLALRGDGDHSSTKLEDGPGSLQSLTADRIKDDIHVPDGVFKGRCSVVNDVFGS